jgi:hypothetical protein
LLPVDDDELDEDDDNHDIVYDNESDTFIVPSPRLRRPQRKYSPDPAIWLAAEVMSRTEAALRLARHLLNNGLTKSDVHVSLTGFELTRRSKPKFPVERFLSERDWLRVDPDDDWRGTYTMEGIEYALVLTSDPKCADVTATLLSNDRLVGHVSRGKLRPTRSSGEHKVLRAAIGRAATFEGYGPTDIPAAVVPRSERFRSLATRWRQSLAVLRAGVLIITVDRAGGVDGLESGNYCRVF